MADISADVVFEQGGAEDTIARLHDFHTRSLEATERIKAAFNTKLVERGVPGPLANSLSESFNAQVVQPSIALSEANQSFIETTTQAKDTLVQGLNDANNIAGM